MRIVRLSSPILRKGTSRLKFKLNTHEIFRITGTNNESIWEDFHAKHYQIAASAKIRNFATKIELGDTPETSLNLL